jgi:hypothetical protein
MIEENQVTILLGETGCGKSTRTLINRPSNPRITPIPFVEIPKSRGDWNYTAAASSGYQLGPSSCRGTWHSITQ